MKVDISIQDELRQKFVGKQEDCIYCNSRLTLEEKDVETAVFERCYYYTAGQQFLLSVLCPYCKRYVSFQHILPLKSR